MTISPCSAGASPVPTPVAEINGRYQRHWRLSSESRCMTNPTRVRRKSTFVDTFDPRLFRRCCNSIRSERILASHEARWLRKPAVKTRSIISNYALLAGANACWTTGKRVIYPTIGSFLDDDLHFERLHTGRSQHLRTRLPKRIKRGTV